MSCYEFYNFYKQRLEEIKHSTIKLENRLVVINEKLSKISRIYDTSKFYQLIKTKENIEKSLRLEKCKQDTLNNNYSMMYAYNIEHSHILGLQNVWISNAEPSKLAKKQYICNFEKNTDVINYISTFTKEDFGTVNKINFLYGYGLKVKGFGIVMFKPSYIIKHGEWVTESSNPLFSFNMNNEYLRKQRTGNGALHLHNAPLLFVVRSETG